MPMTYLLAVQAPAYSIEPGRFATEGAFAEHLKSIRNHLAPRFDRVLLVGPALSRAAYEANRKQLAEVAAVDDGVSFLPVHELGVSAAGFWRQAIPIWRLLRGAARNAGFVHTAPSVDIGRPFLAMLNLAAWLERKPTAFFVDIDFRQNSRRYYTLGEWSLKSYLVNRCIHDVMRSAQVSIAARTCDVVLLKSASMVADFGRGRTNVKFFLDAAHGHDLVIGRADLERKLAKADGSAGSRDLSVIYFGRLVRYKGLDYVIEAIARARSKGARVGLTIVGDGEEKKALVALSRSLGVDQAVTFLPGVKYGPDLFDIVDSADLAVAAPRVEDTPRAALDAMARGLPILAFDTEYFRSLGELSGAVALAAWPEAENLAQQLVALDCDRTRIAEMSHRALAFARENTQDQWVQRRVEWTFAAFDCHHRRLTGHEVREAQPPAQT